MYPGTDGHPALAALAHAQCGVLRKGQLPDVGVPYKYAARQVEAARWTEWGHNVVLLSNAPPSRDQLKMISLLDPSGLTALGSHTALEQGGFRSFAQEAAGVHVLVVRGATYPTLQGVVFHESRRLEERDIVLIHGLPSTRLARSAIDAAAWQRSPRFACAMLAAAVQQAICTTWQLDQTLAVVGRIRHKAHMRLALRDIAEGAHALGEIDVANLCRRFHLRPPDRQQARRDPTGKVRYLDCEWKLDDGTIVVLEIDGRHHLEVGHWEADMKRERKVVISRRWVLRATNYEVRHEPGEVAADLVAMGVPVVRAA